MSNIIITKTDSDLDFDVAYFRIEVINQGYPSISNSGFFGSVYMYAYEGRIRLQELADEIIDFSLNPMGKYCIKLEDTLLGTDGFFALEFSVCPTGCVKIKVDTVIELHSNNMERCEFHIQSDLGSIEQFGKRLKGFSEQHGSQKVFLHLQE